MRSFYFLNINLYYKLASLSLCQFIALLCSIILLVSCYILPDISLFVKQHHSIYTLPHQLFMKLRQLWEFIASGEKVVLPINVILGMEPCTLQFILQ